jgi:hypothetical protein
MTKPRSSRAQVAQITTNETRLQRRCCAKFSEAPLAICRPSASTSRSTAPAS